jgi:hypothetical protein
VDTATYDFEVIVAWQATEQIIDLCYTVQMMGIPIDGPGWLFGDDESMVTSSTIPWSTLNKCCNTLSYHCVQ